MRRIILPFSFFLLFAHALIAQPILTATELNPVVGDGFIHHNCNPAGVTKGGAGAGVTWDMSSLTQTSADTFSYIACSTTPYCDSFPGADLATLGYLYYSTSSTAFANLGLETWDYRTIYTRTYNILEYPLLYNSLRLDTSKALNCNLPFDSSNYDVTTYNDSFICDAYGTVILPTGTYDNVLRLHYIDYAFDTAVGSILTYGRVDIYYWYVAGMHEPLLRMHMPSDTSTITDFVWYTTQMTSVVSNANKVAPELKIFPDPNYGSFTIRSTEPLNTAAISVYNMMGEKVYETTMNGEETKLQLSQSGGIYVLSVNTGNGVVTKKITVMK